MAHKYKLLCSVFESTCPQVIRAGPKLQRFKACRSFWNKEKTYNAILKYFILFSKSKRDKGKKIHICKSCEVYLTPSPFPITDATC